MIKDADKAESNWDLGGMLSSWSNIRQKKQWESESFLDWE